MDVLCLGYFYATMLPYAYCGRRFYLVIVFILAIAPYNKPGIQLNYHISMQYKALLITETDIGKFDRQIVYRNTNDLPQGDILLRVHYSALNFKDGLSATGHKGITKKFPHTPGIEAAGVIEECNTSM